jgi:4-oxalocrotonate tautomerase
MPYVHLKYIREQVGPAQRERLIEGLMDILVNLMHRNPELTVVTVDEVEARNWLIGGRPLEPSDERRGKAAYVNIKISKGTSNPEEMASVIQAGKKLVADTLGSSEETNYFIIEEINPDAWGFDGISMTVRNRLEKEAAGQNPSSKDVGSCDKS